MALDSLPTELLHKILSHRAESRKDLWSCSLVSHNLWEVATSILYSNIGFSIKSEFRDSKRYTEKENETALKTLALNPKLGAKVRTLNMLFPTPYRTVGDNYMTLGQENGDQTARNIPLLTKAALMESALAHHIIDNINGYSQLTQLNLRFSPESHQFEKKSTSLKKLRWEVPTEYAKHGGTIDSWNTVTNILEIASTVFPGIVELDILICRKEDSDATPKPLFPGVAEHRQNAVLLQLRSFRYQGEVHVAERELILDFVRRHHDTLNSLAMTFGFKALDQKMLDYVQQVVKAGAKLKSLAIANKRLTQRWQSHTLPNWSDQAFSPTTPTHGIEIFEMWDIGCSFSSANGKLFSGWNILKVLKIGAPLYEKHEHDGRPHFDDVALEIQSFVKSLPQSIEEIYIELDNCTLTCDDDEDFDPIEKLSPEIFKLLTRLHTLDINAWIADTDKTTGHIPEKAVFCRRRPNQQELDNREKKVAWISRIECVYQEDYAGVSNTTVEMEGYFEGKDADEPWLGGVRSEVSQSSKYWVNGEYLLGVDEDPSDSEEEY